MKSLIVLVILAAAAGGLWYLHDQHGLGYIKFSFGEDDEAAVAASSGPGWRPPSMPVAQPLAVGVVPMRWMQDERWVRGVDSGEKGVALIELAYREHFDVKGDPFLFRARKEEAGALLAQAVADLTSLSESYADNPAALLDINPLLRKYADGQTKTPRR